MNYYNQYPMYNGYSNPYDMRGMMQQQTAQRCEIVRVNGKNGADAYQLAPNSSALLLDETSPIVWLVQTDGAGYKSVSPYSITPYQAESTPDTKALEARIKRLEDIINEQSNTASTKRTKANSDAGQ